jgi:hypothetical protein
MKITKFARLVKQCNVCRVITAGDKQYLTEGNAIYYAENVPKLSTRAEIVAMLELSPKRAKKLLVKLDSVTSNTEVGAFLLSNK